MVKEENFLAEVIASPEDDAPRLVYADWLAENGQVDRAEFIQVQCTLASGVSDENHRADLLARETELLEINAWDWAESLGNDIWEWVFQRGFIERVGMPLHASPETILSVFRRAPIQHLRFMCGYDSLAPFLEVLPRLPLLTGLEFWNLFKEDDELDKHVSQLLASPRLAELRTLILHQDSRAGTVDHVVLIQALEEAPWKRVQEIGLYADLVFAGPSPALLIAMARSRALAHVQRLYWPSAEFDRDSIEAIRSSKYLTQIRQLDLGECRLSLDLWRQILALPQLQSLTDLRLAGSRVTFEERSDLDLCDSDELRAAFDALPAKVDWKSPDVHPDSGGVWQGHTWDEYERKPYFHMDRFIQGGQFRELEVEFRKRSERYLEPAQIAQVMAVNFADYLKLLEPVFQRTIHAADAANAGAIQFSIRARDDDWASLFQLYSEKVDHSEFPSDEYRFPQPIAQFDVPTFPAAGRVYTDRSNRIRWSNILLFARTIAAFGQFIKRRNPTQPIYLHVMYAAYCLHRGKP